ncbi:hypothetical protein QFZ48_000135 [Chitinophaga sp. W2I13]
MGLLITNKKDMVLSYAFRKEEELPYTVFTIIGGRIEVSYEDNPDPKGKAEKHSEERLTDMMASQILKEF